jgi:hypothetical protein
MILLMTNGGFLSGQILEKKYIFFSGCPAAKGWKPEKGGQSAGPLQPIRLPTL